MGGRRSAKPRRVFAVVRPDGMTTIFRRCKARASVAHELGEDRLQPAGVASEVREHIGGVVCEGVSDGGWHCGHEAAEQAVDRDDAKQT